MTGDEIVKEITVLPTKNTKSVVQLIEKQSFNRLNNKSVVQLIEQ